MLRLQFYKPSDDMLGAFNAHFKDNTLKEKLGAYSQTRELSYENVCSVLQILLTVEDMAQMELYTQLKETDVTVRKIGETQYAINLSQMDVSAEDILEVDYAQLVLVPRKSLLAAPLPKPLILTHFPHFHESLHRGDPLRRHVGTIAKVEKTTVYFECLTLNSLSRTFTVLFRSPRIPTRIMYHALEQFDVLRQVRRYLFPIPSGQQPQKIAKCCCKEMSLVNADIAANAEQQQAVEQIVTGPSTLGPYIVFGPPGTGKTTTIVEAILQLYLQQESHIIVTAGSNSACDTIALKICEAIEKDARFPKSAHQSKQNVLLRIFSHRRYKKGLESVHPLVVAYSNCRKGYESFSQITLTKYDIIVATLTMVGIIALTDGGKYTHVFIDEAAAATEPEALLGIVGIKDSDCHVILSGDHKQLGPVIISQRAMSFGLDKSLMERLMDNPLYEVDASGNYDHTLQTRLRRNYRSHPEIVGIYNKLYYNDELIASAPTAKVNMAANWRLLANKQFPILIHFIYGATRRVPKSMSSFNEQEAKVLAWYVKILLSQGIGGGQKVDQRDIGVVSPYRAQCDLIKQLLSEHNMSDVEVGTVNAYQGREKPIIVASLVSSFTNPGFVTNARRLNVLLSRAMSLLILVGNPITLGQREEFQDIIDQCELHCNVLGMKMKKAKFFIKNTKFQVVG